MKLMRTIGLAAALVSTLGTGIAEASYPAGVWVKVEAVQFEPSAAAPTRIRIHGAAMLYNGRIDVEFLNTYTPPERGVLYYECPAAQLATCRDEWNDIVANIDAPPEVCVGLGDQTQPTGTLRRPDQALGAADVYPIHMGVLTGYSPCERIRQFLSGEGDSGIGVGGSGSGGSGSGGSGTAGAGAGGADGAAGTGASGSAGSSSGGSGAIGAAGTAGSNAGASGGQGGTVASAPQGSASEDRGCSVTAVPSAAGATAAGIAALVLLALGRRRRA
jgi:MYXO-CTERM domain-containing protein